jgi:hypothetical protein
MGRVRADEHRRVVEESVQSWVSPDPATNVIAS